MVYPDAPIIIIINAVIIREVWLSFTVRYI